jgi:ribonuclease P protein component
MPSFPLQARLSQPCHYRRVFDGANVKASSKAFLLLALENNDGPSRIGIIVAKKHIRLASRRNRIKRIVREQFRLTPLDRSMDLVVLARSPADELDNPAVWLDIAKLWHQINATADRQWAG